jgi:hypothetical protein
MRRFRGRTANCHKGRPMTSDDQTYDDLLPNLGFEIDAERTAVVITDP